MQQAAVNSLIVYTHRFSLIKFSLIADSKCSVYTYLKHCSLVKRKKKKKKKNICLHAHYMQEELNRKAICNHSVLTPLCVPHFRPIQILGKMIFYI